MTSSSSCSPSRSALTHQAACLPDSSYWLLQDEPCLFTICRWCKFTLPFKTKPVLEMHERPSPVIAKPILCWSTCGCKLQSPEMVCQCGLLSVCAGTPWQYPTFGVTCCYWTGHCRTGDNLVEAATLEQKEFGLGQLHSVPCLIECMHTRLQHTAASRGCFAASLSALSAAGQRKFTVHARWVVRLYGPFA